MDSLSVVRFHVSLSKFFTNVHMFNTLELKFDRYEFEMVEKTNYTLIVTVRKHPTIILREEYQDPKSFRYVVDLNQAESPV